MYAGYTFYYIFSANKCQDHNIKYIVFFKYNDVFCNNNLFILLYDQ